MSATKMREALLRGDLKAFKSFLPKNSQDQAEYIFTRVLGGQVNEELQEEEPLGESFRSADLLRLIDEVINEKNQPPTLSTPLGPMALSLEPGDLELIHKRGKENIDVYSDLVKKLKGKVTGRDWKPGKTTKPKKKKDIEEMSSMAGGSIEGGAHGASGGPWHGLDTEEENEKQNNIKN